jgi:hypothetical protein
MRLFGHRVLSRLEEEQVRAAAVEAARLRWENRELLQENSDLRMLYAMSLADTGRLQARLRGNTGQLRQRDSGTHVPTCRVTG